MADRIKEAGFINVTERLLKIPIGPWLKNKLLRKVGLYYQAAVLDGLRGIALGPSLQGFRLVCRTSRGISERYSG